MTRLSLQCVLIVIATALLMTPSRAEVSQFSKNHQAAELGNAEAQLKLGLAYEKGDGIPQDYAKAAAWYRRAACQGNTDAQMKISEAYYFGRGVPQDFMLAGWWNIQFAKKHSAVAEAKQREREARAAQGDAEAQQQLRNASAKFMKVIGAAENGDAEAQVLLGMAYSSGKSVAQDDSKAVAWYRRAAEQGNQHGLCMLAGAYDAGIGVRKDRVEAFKWFSICLAQSKGLERDVIKSILPIFAKTMTREQILVAQKRAQQWTPTPSKK